MKSTFLNVALVALRLSRYWDALYTLPCTHVSMPIHAHTPQTSLSLRAFHAQRSHVTHLKFCRKPSNAARCSNCRSAECRGMLINPMEIQEACLIKDTSLREMCYWDCGNWVPPHSAHPKKSPLNTDCPEGEYERLSVVLFSLTCRLKVHILLL